MDTPAPARPALGPFILLTGLLLGLSTLVPAARSDGVDLLSMSLEALMQVPVVSAAASAHTVADTPAAVHVITAEDIRRSGTRTLPDLLRQVAGMDVARISDTTWAVSARGFNARFANMLLVLVDGRSVYSPIFGGVYWDVQSVPLEDVERIEVILGPGGTLWGANAVNGVINVITRDAADTVGSHTEVGRGTDEAAFLAARQGAALPDGSHLRLYARAFDRSDSEWHETRGGFRWDGTRDDGRLTLQGETYAGGSRRMIWASSLTPPATTVRADTQDTGGGHLMLTWRAGSVDAGWQARAYADRADRQDGLGRVRRATADLELRHHRRFAAHTVTGGLGFRQVTDRTGGDFQIRFLPDHRRTRWSSLFLQDEATVAEAVRLTVGIKLEHNDFTGLEPQPSARLVWHPAPEHALWAAVSRAVRVPSRGHHDARYNQQVIDGTPPLVVAVVGNPDAPATDLVALEAGYRGRPEPTLSVDLAAFVNRYRHVNTLETGTPFLETDPAPDHLLQPLVIDGRAHGLTWGGEATATWQASPRTRLTASYAWLRQSLRADAGGNDTFHQSIEGGSPRHQARLAVRASPAPDVDLDAALRAVGRLRNPVVPGYAALDLRVARRLGAGLSLSVTGENLLTPRHWEFADSGPADVIAEEVPRTVFARVTWAP